ncbi:MAG: hypothetical protein ACOZCL_07010 [Bacillota bacterium]
MKHQGYFKQPKSLVNFEAQTENEIRTDLENKINKNMESIRQNIDTLKLD